MTEAAPNHILRKKTHMSTVKDYETIIRHAGEVMESIDQKFLDLAEKGDWDIKDAETYLELVTVRQDMKDHISELKKDRKTARKIERMKKDHDNIVEKERERRMAEVWNLDRQGNLLDPVAFTFSAWAEAKDAELQEEILELRY